jgi:nicotinate (nicotinamide) nucleotide adenylyltransferase
MSATEAAPPSPSGPLTIGVFGGSFNPIHLGHALLAITTQQTKHVDHVVLVPVYKHAVKRDLLPFADRVAMCRLAVEPFAGSVSVSTVEEETNESNGAMLRALKKLYPPDTRFLYICGDDFVRWMDRPKGLETLQEVHGLIVQRRLHKQEDSTAEQHRFFKEPLDVVKIRTVALQLNLEVDFIYGELPHFSSTLVRKAPGHWRSFLTSAVVHYLDERPHLLQQLMKNLEADAAREKAQVDEMTVPAEVKPPHHVRSPSFAAPLQLQLTRAAASVMRGLEAVHALQRERGRTGLYLSVGGQELADKLQQAQASTDAALAVHEGIKEKDEYEDEFDEVKALEAELQRIPVWLQWDRRVLEKRCDALRETKGTEGWLARLDLVEKFHSRIDVLIGATVRALTEILEVASTHRQASQSQDNMKPGTSDRTLPELLFKWCEGKEALGRLRAFVCAGGPTVPAMVRQSLPLRERLNQHIDTKERRLARVLSYQAAKSSAPSAPDALHKLLEAVTEQEYIVMGCFSNATPLPIEHKILQEKSRHSFDVEQFFESSSAAIDFLLSFSKALAATACATA